MKFNQISSIIKSR